MGMWQMLAEALLGGNSLWAAPVYISAAILRDQQQVATPVPFQLAPVVLGLMGHMMNTFVLAALFGWIAPKLSPSLGGPTGLGMLYGIAVFAVMWFLVVPLADPVMLRLNTVSFLAAHVMWGIALGLVYGFGSAPPPRLQEQHA
ncbi:MAG: hypothetical protein AAB289_17590, partial [Chloroflexota bacterium]